MARTPRTIPSAGWQGLPGNPRGCRAAPFIELLLDDPRGGLPGLDQTSKGGSLRSTGRFCRHTYAGRPFLKGGMYSNWISDDRYVRQSSSLWKSSSLMKSEHMQF